MVSRFGGDDFTLLLTDLATRDEAGVVAGRLLAALSERFIIGEHEVCVSASIGIALYPVDTTDAELLLACADRAMYAAKDNGKRNFQFYSSDLNERSHIRKEQL
jgi:diguanylate cyclase (GGDEF)-like protein